MFFSSLHFAIVNSSYSNIVLKPKQVKCLEAVYYGKDVVAVLPTGYGKSLIFHLLPSLFYDKINTCCGRQETTVHPVIIVVSPLNALIKDQIRRGSEGNIKATVLGVKKIKDSDNVNLDFDDADSSLLKDAKYDIIYMHPEAFLSCKQGMELLQSSPYQRSVQAIIVDEAHCILEWGNDFRTDYSNLAMLCATFPSVPVVALTATASKADIVKIKESLNLTTPMEITANPDRPNIFYGKVFRSGNDLDFFQGLLHNIAMELKKRKLGYPLTILYLPLKWCGFAYKYMDKQLGKEQYYPFNCEALPENRLFAQYHAPQTNAMKEQILKELSSSLSKLRVIFATVALGMGIDIPSIHHVIHVGPPRTIREYFQETGRAGRDGKQSTAVLYYNNHDIAKNREGISENVRTYCRLQDSCLRRFLLSCLDFQDHDAKDVCHLCCSFCKLQCKCLRCNKDIPQC